ncbi:MAG: NUDIX domain-containing protein [Candidatus Promineifilaceae bacterium]|nr:NUDIX domain-containing protein [Candidatus Promineifilaceae bacterium]
MLVATNGLVVNQFGQVLLIRRDDTRTWALPGGMLEAGELPPEGAAREVGEETGLQVTPARLVGLSFWSDTGDDYLVFIFRCLPGGGELAASEESPDLGFVPPTILPRTFYGLHRRRLAQGLAHTGGPPEWFRQQPSLALKVWRRVVGPLVYLWKDRQRRRLGLPPYSLPPRWTVGAFVIISDEQDRVLWVRRTDQDIWNLPGGQVETGEAPWEAAVRETKEETGLDVRLTDLSGVYVKPANDGLILTFTAAVSGGQLRIGPEAAAFDYFKPGEEPANSLAKQVVRAADAFNRRGTVIYRRQPATKSPA